MRITKQELEAKAAQAQIDNSIGWLDTEKMNSQGVKTSKPLCCTGYVKPENPFRIMQQPNPRRH